MRLLLVFFLFLLPKLSLVPKSANDQQVQFDRIPATNQVHATQSSAFKFPAKLLVYQRRPKPSIQSVSLPSQQADICLHQESSAGFSQISNFPDGVLANGQEHSAGNSNIPGGVLASVQEHFVENSNVSGDVLVNDQEHSLTVSKSSFFPASQESQVSINFSSVSFQGLSISANTETLMIKALLRH
ncbi:hypothetical protein V6N11_054986 [Hibiscus sabdariffa]|uniref:Uncharacterized protein n=1 Tax=Hibiscus sabdariffa TaxID=183260 RepID=A0ABR2P3M4_9ROSI